MSEASAVPPAAPGPEPGFLGKIFGLYFGPKETFVHIVRKPTFWLPLLLFALIQIAFMGLWLSKMDVVEFLRIQTENAGKPFQAPPPQALGAIRAFMGALALMGPILMFVFGAVYLFIFRFFYASEVTFRQSMAILSHTVLATTLVSTPLIIGVFYLKGDWNLPPQEALRANPSLFFERDEVSKPLWTALTSLDLFMFWLLFLLAVGFGVATRRTTGSAFWGVASVWFVMTAFFVLLSFF